MADPAHILSPAEYYRFPLPEDFEASHREFGEHIHTLQRSTQRVGTILRLMQQYFLSSKADDTELCEDDIAEMVGLLAETLPHHYTGVNDPLEKFSTAATHAMRAATRREGLMGEIIDALAAAGRSGATLEELREAANKVYLIARDDSTYEPYLKKLVDVIESRGFKTTTRQIGNFTPELYVSDSESERANRRSMKAVEKLVSAANEETKISRRRK